MLISIITINFNDLEGLKKTMASVFEQSYPNIEYIVIDGASDDGSKEYILAHKERLAYWISEPDNGIYNAMNKGIDKATGDYLLFLNSGDAFNNLKVLDDFVSFKPFEEIVYGNTMLIYAHKKPKLKVMPSDLGGMTVFYRTLNHQSVFFNKRIFQNGKRYNEDYKILADWVLYNEIVLLQNGSYRHVDLIVADYDTGGFSSKPENKVFMQNDRNKFFASHISFFVPHFIKIYESLKNNDKAVILEVKIRFQKAFLLLRKALRMIIKGY